MSIEDIVMREDLFDYNKELDFHFGEVEAKLEAVGISMPEFRTFDEVKPITLMKWDEYSGEFYTTKTEARSEKPYGVYKDARSQGFDVDFDPSVHKSGIVEGFGGMLSVPSERKGARTVMIETVDRRGLDFHDYYSWLKEARCWLDNQDDFMAAYGFLSGHPAFWKRPRPETHPNEWDTDNGVATIWSYPTYRNDEAGTIVMLMETGSMIEPERKDRYHDLRLDTYEDTYELGIIATAKKVHKFFGLDGSERPDVEYEKSKLELLLDKRLAEMDKATAVDKATEV